MPVIAAGPSAAHVEGKDVKESDVSIGAWRRAIKLLLWVAFIFFHAVGAAFFGFTAHCYRILPNSGLDRWLTFFSLGMGTERYGKLALVHAIVAAIHTGFILQMIALSIKKRQLTFSGGPVHRYMQTTDAIGTARVFSLLKWLRWPRNRCIEGA